MKSIFTLTILLFTSHCFAQCNYYYLQNNKTVTIGMFDRKGKESGQTVYKVSNVKKAGSTSSGDVQSEVFDKKGKSIAKGTGTMQCKSGILMMDMKMLMNPQQAQQFKDADVKGKGAYLEYPTSVKVGETLEDASFDMDINMESGIAANLSIDITNRKVEAKESITTPAGTWQAFKITYHSKTVLAMGISIPINMEMTEWFVPDFGVVKTESKWGKTELLSID
ncbi:MAG TPA: hypothetical protein PK191_04575 [Niabella sp.]|nr:hypothetical protein [Niabella sp.]HOZ95924.1 hypothetical protein [Niabella sp.]HQW15836.1 hypothetical protein [Niabella sp.]HQX20976.1 hypothetical protein [Niabella sp.]HQX41233.1 hypothetical protein [Niabella sp.]